MKKLYKDYTIEKNFYAYLADKLEEMSEKVQLPAAVKQQFLLRNKIAIAEYRTAAAAETSTSPPATPNGSASTRDSRGSCCAS
jgi:hypothetical protein